MEQMGTRWGNVAALGKALIKESPKRPSFQGKEAPQAAGLQRRRPGVGLSGKLFRMPRGGGQLTSLVTGTVIKCHEAPSGLPTSLQDRKITAVTGVGICSPDPHSAQKMTVSGSQAKAQVLQAAGHRVRLGKGGDARQPRSLGALGCRRRLQDTGRAGQTRGTSTSSLRPQPSGQSILRSLGPPGLQADRERPVLWRVTWFLQEVARGPSTWVQ